MPYIQKGSNMTPRRRQEADLQREFSSMSAQLPLGDVPPLPKSMFQNQVESSPESTPQSLYFELQQRRTPSPQSLTARPPKQQRGRSPVTPLSAQDGQSRPMRTPTDHHSPHQLSTPPGDRLRSVSAGPSSATTLPREHIQAENRSRPTTPTNYYPSYQGQPIQEPHAQPRPQLQQHQQQHQQPHQTPFQPLRQRVLSAPQQHPSHAHAYRAYQPQPLQQQQYGPPKEPYSPQQQHQQPQHISPLHTVPQQSIQQLPGGLPQHATAHYHQRAQQVSQPSRAQVPQIPRVPQARTVPQVSQAQAQQAAPDSRIPHVSHAAQVPQDHTRIPQQQQQIPPLRSPQIPQNSAAPHPVYQPQSDNSYPVRNGSVNALHIQTQPPPSRPQYSDTRTPQNPVPQKSQLYPTETQEPTGYRGAPVGVQEEVPVAQHHHHHHHRHQRFGSFNGGLVITNNAPVAQNRKSPILQQSLSFLRGNRNASSNSLASDYSTAGDMDKYHTTGKTMTSSGRVLPQRLEMRGSIKDRSSKSRSFSSLTRRVTSTASLRNSGDKERIYSTGSLSSRVTSSPTTKKSSVNPSMLSQVAKAFKDKIQLGTRYKNGLEYRDAFTGVGAVDVIAKIIRTSDRNLALLLGRSLDAQKFFHDVTYEHRLRDSTNEVYQFSEDVFSPYNDDGQQPFNRQNSLVSSMEFNDNDSTLTPNAVSAQLSTSTTGVNGVFTLLTECYSPTCSRDNLCYSIACPRRLEQQARLGMKSSGLARSDSRLSFTQEEQKPYWQLTVPRTVLDSLDKREIKRQECIFETIYSERDFVKDLEYLREFWIRPLSETKIIREPERGHFVNTVFYDIDEIWEVNSKFAEALTKRQQGQPVVKEIGDLFLEFIPRFEPFIKYGAGQVMGRYEFDRQKRHNPFFVRFIEDTSNRAESRRLDVSSYLSKPTTRPARYPLLLKSIRNHTDPESEDYKNLGKAIEMLQKMLTRINFETGKASDRLNLFLLKQKLVFRPGELVDLRLTAENRKLLYQCILKKRNYQDKDKQGEVQVYLFDHALLLVKVKVINKREVYRVYQRPMHIPLMFLSLKEEAPTLKMVKKAASTGSSTGSATATLGKNDLPPGNFQLASTTSKSPLSFTYIGRNGYKLTLYATPAVQRMLVEKIDAQSKKLIEDNDVFTLTPLSSDFFDINNKINCVVPFDGGRKLLYGTDAGIYVSDVKIAENNRRYVSRPLKIIGKINIIQADILGEYQLLLALSDKKLFYWPLDVLKGGDASKNAKLGKELMNHVSFFKVGVCSGRMLVCAAKSSSNIIRVFEPIDPINQRRQKKKFETQTKDVNFSSEPVSVSFLKTKLCVGCSKGFEIVSLDNNVMEQLLDPADTSLDFAIGREGLKPLEIDRINSDFLLSYSSFSFFINHNGWRSRPKWIVHWEGVPHAFALWYPYLLAFDNNMIEIRHVETGDLLRVIVAENIRFLHSSSQEILYAYEDERGYDVVASLDFWDKTVKNSKSANPSPLFLQDSTTAEDS
ncbi:DEKNAAC100169 [Brettanomyces naardenensis]|uniref:DEKNAAC100169 n=1 Tax=Brettanomyces naardenensis TaxID=13370 RepID=A0A448YFT2_BRENA|nr:DEKNAAC100169 [Brettanomyces naardenensis]